MSKYNLVVINWVVSS